MTGEAPILYLKRGFHLSLWVYFLVLHETHFESRRERKNASQRRRQRQLRGDWLLHPFTDHWWDVVSSVWQKSRSRCNWCDLKTRQKHFTARQHSAGWPLSPLTTTYLVSDGQSHVLHPVPLRTSHEQIWTVFPGYLQAVSLVYTPSCCLSTSAPQRVGGQAWECLF